MSELATCIFCGKPAKTIHYKKGDIILGEVMPSDGVIQGCHIECWATQGKELAEQLQRELSRSGDN